ncbi:DUF2187 family protein [Isobaculum melis]|uniref:Uncharacterized protein YkvS n=1 Tax=Isobaculum melis TaxID=142588 RepID=A0A1H9T8M4_9LACT|nr:DUF2187 family protein [Isobaculum melis]SER93488.1 Uncharacterized protein YkvS [Isobaculum melis]
MTQAEIGDLIVFREGIQGIVEKIYVNSVMVDISKTPNYAALDLGTKTIVSHKDYEIIPQTAD